MSTPESAPPSDSSPSHAFAVGDKLAGCYALTRRLESESGAEVWLADDEVLGKEVALHFIPETVRKDSRALQELRLDIKRNRQLVHPNMLRVYDLVEEPGWVAISMETFEGQSLAARFAGQAGKGNKVAEIQPWAEQLANTIEEAHRINVLHRGLTPANVFLSSASKLLVANFGISGTIRDALTRAGAPLTPAVAFQSPQQIEGKAAARTDDVYALGAILFAALTGRSPFAGVDPSAEVLAGVSPTALAELQKPELGVPPQWQKTITACLDKSPEARPQTAAEVARLLTETAPAPAAAAAAAVIPPVKTPASDAPAAAGTTLAAVVGTSAATGAAAAAAFTEPKPAGEKTPPAKAPESTGSSIKKEPLKKEAETFSSPAPASTSGSKTPERSPVKDLLPKLYPEESRFPMFGLAAAAAVIAIIAIIYHFATSGKKNTEIANQPEKAELRAITSPAPAVVPSTSPAPEKTAGANTATPPAKLPAPTPDPIAAANARALAEKASALEKVRMAAQEADKMYADLLQQRQTADASVAEVQKNIDAKTKAAEPLKKAADEATAQFKKLETAQAAAEAAAAEALKVAADKTRMAEEGRAALLDAEKKNAEKMTAPQQALAEIATLQKSLAERQQAAAETAKALAAAEAAKQQQTAAIAENEREMERIKSADQETRRQQEAAEAERRKLEQEMAEMQRAFKERMKDLEEKQRMLKNPGSAPAPNSPPPATSVTPAAISQPVVSTPTLSAPLPTKPATPEPLKMASVPATPAPLPAPGVPAKNTAGGNSLGMKFAPVGDVEFCIWQTQVKDFEVFAKAVNLKSTSWKGPGFKQGPDHPVVNVSWQEAVAFCKWLTDKEHKENTLPANRFYRLPNDLEWSKAVGLPEEGGKTPELRDMGVQDVYPWGTQWPPPPGAGNYTGEETGSDVAIKGYDDGFAWTSPVGSFPPNKLGLYDMGGNVWQWCMDGWNAESKAKVLRGASWYNGALKLSLLSSCRVHAAPDSSTDNYGFRIVRATDAAKPAKR